MNVMSNLLCWQKKNIVSLRKISANLPAKFLHNGDSVLAHLLRKANGVYSFEYEIVSLHGVIGRKWRTVWE